MYSAFFLVASKSYYELFGPLKHVSKHTFHRILELEDGTLRSASLAFSTTENWNNCRDGEAAWGNKNGMGDEGFQSVLRTPFRYSYFPLPWTDDRKTRAWMWGSR